jgi:cytochrome b561
MTDSPYPTRPAGTLPFRDTSEVYGRMSRLLHWTIAVLVLYQFTGMGLRVLFGKQEWISPFVTFHQPVGTILFVVVAIRAAWALSNRGSRPAHGRHFWGRAASLGHGLLYVVMLAVPAIALIRAYGNNREFAPLGFTIFPAQEPPVTWMVDLGGALHGELGWLLGILILGHVVMVGVHESMWRDGTLARMLGRGRT